MQTLPMRVRPWDSRLTGTSYMIYSHMLHTAAHAEQAGGASYKSLIGWLWFEKNQ